MSIRSLAKLKPETSQDLSTPPQDAAPAPRPRTLPKVRVVNPLDPVLRAAIAGLPEANELIEPISKQPGDDAPLETEPMGKPRRAVGFPMMPVAISVGGALIALSIFLVSTTRKPKVVNGGNGPTEPVLVV